MRGMRKKIKRKDSDSRICMRRKHFVAVNSDPGHLLHFPLI
jgi:hypothetical protein